jgi:hypothetical protein
MGPGQGTGHGTLQQQRHTESRWKRPLPPNAQAHLAPSAPHYRTASRPRSLPPRAGPSLSVRTACKTRRAARSRREEGKGGSHRTQGERGRGRSSKRGRRAQPLARAYRGGRWRMLAAAARLLHCARGADSPTPSQRLSPPDLASREAKSRPTTTTPRRAEMI